MTPQTIRVLTECDTMLAETATRYTLALQRLHEASPGFPAHTPGAGEPGGGKGFTAGSITERLVIPGGQRKPARWETRNHSELDALERLRQEPLHIALLTAWFAAQLQLPTPDWTPGPLRETRLLDWARRIIQHLLETETDPPTKLLNTTHRAIDQLHRTVTAWAYTPTTPTKPNNPHLLPDDLTGLWCRSCLRIGARNPRHRGDRCRWCYVFEGREGFTPPCELLEIHEHRTVYDRDVEPHRKAHRDRNKKRRRKAG